MPRAIKAAPYTPRRKSLRLAKWLVLFFAVLGPMELLLIALYHAKTSGLFLVAMSALLLITAAGLGVCSTWYLLACRSTGCTE